jgi:hypothetical protein
MILPDPIISVKTKPSFFIGCHSLGFSPKINIVLKIVSPVRYALSQLPQETYHRIQSFPLNFARLGNHASVTGGHSTYFRILVKFPVL